MKTFKNDSFFARLEASCLAVTFNDVRLKSGYSKVGPTNVQMQTKFSRNIPLNIPIVSAAMDTVTEYLMAISMAEAGGFGVIHKGKGMTPEVQAEQVGKVKNHRHTKIGNPITVNQNQTLREVTDMKKEKSYDFHSFPVLNDDNKLVGLLTRHHFDLNNDSTKLIGSIMTVRDKVITAPAKTTVSEAAAIMRQSEKGVLPLINKDGELTGMYVSADIQRLTRAENIFNVDKEGHLLVGAAVGTGQHELDRAIALIEAGVDAIIIDTAHGDSEAVYIMIKELKRLYPHIDIVAGNVSEADSAERLAKAGVDGVKIGQGGGSICTTRIVAGIGCPQVTAVYNCAKALRGSGVITCSDGGIVNSGDIPIAIGAGADCVMLGKGLAGTDESPGEIRKTQKGSYKIYRGMGSEGARKDRPEAARERYRQEGLPGDKFVPEGITSVVPYDGPVADVLFKLVGGLRAGMGYVGAANIAELKEKADFHRISSAGWQESNPHDVIVFDDSAQ